MRPRGAPTSVFLLEAERRAAEAKEAAKVDPWESDGDEEEEKDAAAAEEEDALRGQRMHAWVREGGREGGRWYRKGWRKMVIFSVDRRRRARAEQQNCLAIATLRKK